MTMKNYWICFLNTFCCYLLIFSVSSQQVVSSDCQEVKSILDSPNYANNNLAEYLYCTSNELQPSESKIIKSSTDFSQYQLYNLSNGLRFMLLINPSIGDIATFEISIGAGAIFGPQNAQGIAHFLEHMLFLGSINFQKQNEYEKFVAQHSGDFNALTGDVNTKYFFQIQQNYLNQATMMLVDAVQKPLLKEEAIRKQINAVNQEFELLKNKPSWQIVMITKTLFGQGHQKQFNPGYNRSLLSDKNWGKSINEVIQYPDDTYHNLQQTLQQFHNNYYSADNMVAALAIKQNNTKLIAQVIASLLKIQNKNKKINRMNFNQAYNQKFSLPPSKEFALFKIEGNEHILINHTSSNLHAIIIQAFPVVNESLLIKDSHNILPYFLLQLKRKNGIRDAIYSLVRQQTTNISLISSFSINIQKQVGIYYPSIAITIQMTKLIEDSQLLISRLRNIIVKGLQATKITSNCLQRIRDYYGKLFDNKNYFQADTIQYLNTLTDQVLQSKSNQILSSNYLIGKQLTQQQLQRFNNLHWKVIAIEKKSNSISKSDIYQMQPYLQTPYKLKKIIQSDYNVQLNIQQCYQNYYINSIKKQTTKKLITHKNIQFEWIQNNVLSSSGHPYFPESSSIVFMINLPSGENKMSLFFQVLNNYLNTDKQLNQHMDLLSQVTKNVKYQYDESQGNMIVSITGPYQSSKIFIKNYLSKLSNAANMGQHQFDNNIMELNKKLSNYYLLNKPSLISWTYLQKIYYPGLKSLKQLQAIIKNKEYLYSQFQKQFQIFVSRIKHDLSYKPIAWGISQNNLQNKIDFKDFTNSIFNQYFPKSLTIDTTSTELYVDQFSYKLNYQCQGGKIDIQYESIANMYFVQYYIPYSNEITLENKLLTEMLAETAYEPYFNELRTEKKMGYSLDVVARSLHFGGQGVSFLLSSSDYDTDAIQTSIRKWIKEYYIEFFDETNQILQKFKNLKKSVLQKNKKPFESPTSIEKFMANRLSRRFSENQNVINWKKQCEDTMKSITLKKFQEAIKLILDNSRPVILKFNPSTTNKNPQTNLQQFRKTHCKQLNKSILI